MSSRSVSSAAPATLTLTFNDGSRKREFSMTDDILKMDGIFNNIVNQMMHPEEHLSKKRRLLSTTDSEHSSSPEKTPPRKVDSVERRVAFFSPLPTRDPGIKRTPCAPLRLNLNIKNGIESPDASFEQRDENAEPLVIPDTPQIVIPDTPQKSPIKNPQRSPIASPVRSSQSPLSESRPAFYWSQSQSRSSSGSHVPFIIPGRVSDSFDPIEFTPPRKLVFEPRKTAQDRLIELKEKEEEERLQELADQWNQAQRLEIFEYEQEALVEEAFSKKPEQEPEPDASQPDISFLLAQEERAEEALVEEMEQFEAKEIYELVINYEEEPFEYGSY